MDQNVLVASTPTFGGLTLTPLTSALLVTNGSGVLAEYGGAGCTNQVVEDVSAVGGTTCVSINNGYWSGTALSIGNGGLGAAFTDPNADRLMFWDDSLGAITGIATLNNLSISGTALSVADSYLFNTGDVGTGVYDFGGATSFEIVNGTAPTVDTLGEIALDTTDNQFLIATGTTPAVLPTKQRVWSATVASSSVDFVSGGRIPLPNQRDGFTITEIWCWVESGTSVVINVDTLAGGAQTDTLTCDTDGASDTAQSQNTLKTAGSLNVLEIGTVTGAVDYLSFSVWGTWTRE
jgi:hypothetical protein